MPRKQDENGVGVRPSVLLVGNFLGGHRGSQPVAQDLAKRLRERGWPIRETSTKWGKPQRLADMVWTIWRHRRNYDVAHIDVYSGPAFRWAEVAASALTLLGKPYLLTLRGGSLPKFAIAHPARVTRLLRSAELATVPSRYLLEAMDPYTDALRLLPNPLALESYPYRHRSQLAPRLVWLRAFHPIYDPVLAVRVLARLTHDFPGVTMTMVGPDKGLGSLERVREEARRLDVEDRLEIRGWVPKSGIGALLSQFDVFLNTTTIDNTPVTVMEALACGLCVVSSDAGGLPYLLEHGREGLLVPSGDDAAMAVAVATLLRDPNLASLISAAGRRRAQEWSWKRVLPQWEDLLMAVSGKSAGVRPARYGGVRSGRREPELPPPARASAG